MSSILSIALWLLLLHVPALGSPPSGGLFRLKNHGSGALLYWEHHEETVGAEIEHEVRVSADEGNHLFLVKEEDKRFEWSVKLVANGPTPQENVYKLVTADNQTLHAQSRGTRNEVSGRWEHKAWTTHHSIYDESVLWVFEPVGDAFKIVNQVQDGVDGVLYAANMTAAASVTPFMPRDLHCLWTFVPIEPGENDTAYAMAGGVLAAVGAVILCLLGFQCCRSKKSAELTSDEDTGSETGEEDLE
eukprot:TRINITY_DN122818_c0_g1_i1.p1 TRINITY_DN122818_c0_g1~~TRINITY_DN122818_c0_g1_i1.p1  ORF type:complete len:245 (-),score=24.05 TRINITY_DN122818_c0_g1_i1:67-801(-)